MVNRRADSHLPYAAGGTVPAWDRREAEVNDGSVYKSDLYISSLLNLDRYVRAMTSQSDREDQLYYERSARTDLRAWLMLMVGAVFMYGGATIDPRDNCSNSGECAPWLVPLAFIVGAVFGLGGFAQLLANPRRGSRIDPETGTLIWWQNRVGSSEGDSGQIAPARIGAIRIVKQSEGSDEVHLYDLDGKRQFYFDEEVIPQDQERWVKAMTDRWPHIKVTIVE